MRRTILLLVALLPLLAHGQNLNTYTATSAQGQWNSIALTGTQLTSVVGDYGTQTVVLPFNFLFGNNSEFSFSYTETRPEIPVSI